MSETIDDQISVNLCVYPTSIVWRGREYQVSKVGMHHTTHEGRTLFHIFSVTDGVNFFKLEFDTETLGWKLLEIEAHV